MCVCVCSNQPAAGETDGAMTPSVTSSRVKRQYGDITINEKLVAYLLNKHLPKNCRRVGCGSVDLQKRFATYTTLINHLLFIILLLL